MYPIFTSKLKISKIQNTSFETGVLIVLVVSSYPFITEQICLLNWLKLIG